MKVSEWLDTDTELRTSDAIFNDDAVPDDRRGRLLSKEEDGRSVAFHSKQRV